MSVSRLDHSTLISPTFANREADTKALESQTPAPTYSQSPIVNILKPWLPSEIATIIACYSTQGMLEELRYRFAQVDKTEFTREIGAISSVLNAYQTAFDAYQVALKELDAFEKQNIVHQMWNRSLGLNPHKVLITRQDKLEKTERDMQNVMLTIFSIVRTEFPLLSISLLRNALNRLEDDKCKTMIISFLKPRLPKNALSEPDQKEQEANQVTVMPDLGETFDPTDYIYIRYLFEDTEIQDAINRRFMDFAVHGLLSPYSFIGDDMAEKIRHAIGSSILLKYKAIIWGDELEAMDDALKTFLTAEGLFAEGHESIAVSFAMVTSITAEGLEQSAVAKRLRDVILKSKNLKPEYLAKILLESAIGLEQEKFAKRICNALEKPKGRELNAYTNEIRNALQGRIIFRKWVNPLFKKYEEPNRFLNEISWELFTILRSIPYVCDLELSDRTIPATPSTIGELRKKWIFKNKSPENYGLLNMLEKAFFSERTERRLVKCVFVQYHDKLNDKRRGSLIPVIF